MINKICLNAIDTLASLKDGASILVSGFGNSGVPEFLLEKVLESGRKDLVIVNNNAAGADGVGKLIAAGRVRKVICSFPRSTDASTVVEDAFRAGKLEIECVPQGTLVERIRAGGAGLGPFFTPTAYGTLLAENKEQRTIDGKGYVLEQPIRCDYALVKAHKGDRWGNLSYRMAGRNFGPVMSTAGERTIAQIDEIVALGELDPEQIVTPGAFVDAVVLNGIAS